ncbi:MAG: TetR/AcrR family transcriptional regulator [Rhodospirillaceae bacterium]
MSEAHRRKKQPELLQRSLLQCAARIAENSGLTGLTLNAVSSAAGVSKGALQHHFRSKQALLDALFADLHTQFMEEIRAEIQKDPDPHGRGTRAYIRVLHRQAGPGSETGLLRALTALMLTDAEKRESWCAMVNKDLEESYGTEDQRQRFRLCRLAIDGLWMSDLLGYNRMTPRMRSEMVSQLEAMTREDPDNVKLTSQLVEMRSSVCSKSE